MIHLEEIPKDLEYAPMMFNLKGRYMMYFLYITSFVFIAMIAGIVIFFLRKNAVLSILSFIVGIVLIVIAYMFFYFKSSEKKYKGLAYMSNILSNRNLKKVLDESRDS